MPGNFQAPIRDHAANPLLPAAGGKGGGGGGDGDGGSLGGVPSARISRLAVFCRYPRIVIDERIRR